MPFTCETLVSQKRFILALDQGTTSCRAILFNHAGAIEDSAQKEFPQIFPQPGWVEHDAEQIWQTQLTVARQLLSAKNVGPEDIAAIGITNQRETTVVWDRRSGKPIHNAIVWQDRRTAGFCDLLKRDDHAANDPAQNRIGDRRLLLGQQSSMDSRQRARRP